MIQLQLELERTRSSYQQEKEDAKRALESQQSAAEADKQRALAELRSQLEAEKQAAIDEVKKKQWCAECAQEVPLYSHAFFVYTPKYSRFITLLLLKCRQYSIAAGTRPTATTLVNRPIGQNIWPPAPTQISTRKKTRRWNRRAMPKSRIRQPPSSGVLRALASQPRKPCRPPNRCR